MGSCKVEVLGSLLQEPRVHLAAGFGLKFRGHGLLLWVRGLAACGILDFGLALVSMLGKPFEQKFFW